MCDQPCEACEGLVEDPEHDAALPLPMDALVEASAGLYEHEDEDPNNIVIATSKVYMVKKIIPVCQHIGCWKQATWDLWRDGLHVGEFCYEHGNAGLT